MTDTFLQNERDLSVRQRAVDLLYAMCDREQAEEIVGELLAYLEKADYSIREELVRASVWFERIALYIIFVMVFFFRLMALEQSDQVSLYLIL